jgi:hypothetical protein
LGAWSSKQGHGGVEEKEGCCSGNHRAHLAFQLVAVGGLLVSSMAGNVPYVFSSVHMPRFCFSSPTQTKALYRRNARRWTTTPGLVTTSSS